MKKRIPEKVMEKRYKKQENMLNLIFIPYLIIQNKIVFTKTSAWTMKIIERN